MTPIREVVIARYSERLGWIADLPEDAKITVYNKGADDLETARLPKLTEIRLPNVGREAQTYLYHICGRWSRLADVTAFLHGDADRHFGPDAGTAVGRMLKAGKLVSLSGELTEDPAEKWIRADLRSAYEEIFGTLAPVRIRLWPFAHWIVPLHAIRSRPLDLWERALALFDESAGDSGHNKHLGFVMERLWGALFDYGGA